MPESNIPMQVPMQEPSGLEAEVLYLLKELNFDWVFNFPGYLIRPKGLPDCPPMYCADWAEARLYLLGWKACREHETTLPIPEGEQTP